MKKVLSIVLSVAMLMTVACSMFVMPVSAAADVESGYLNIMNIENVVEGAENVTVNEDGSWTITGKIGIAVNQTFDLDTVKYIYQDLDAATEVKIFFYDAAANYGFGLYDNWAGPTYYPVGNYTNNDDLSGIYHWNGLTVGEGNVATLTSVYIEFPETEENPSVTLNKLYLNDGTLMVTPLTSGIHELMNIEDVKEGAENVTVNEDGSWTITGRILISVNELYDLDTMKYICQDLVAEAPMDIILYDGYANRWIHMYNNWVGPDYFPVGAYSGNNGIDGIYSWNKYAVGEGNLATLTNVIIEFDATAENPSVTLNQLYLNDGTLKPTNIDFGDAAYTYDTEVDLAVKDAAAWSLTSASGSNPAVEVVDNTLVFSNDAGLWPSAYIDFATPYTVDNTAMLYVDFSVANGAATTIFLYCGDANATTYAEDYSNVITVNAADMGYGNYKGFITLAEVAPAPTENGTCFDAEGNLQINAIRVFSTTANGQATPLNPTVTVRDIKLCYTAPVEEEPAIPGDLNGNGRVEMREALKVYQAASADGVGNLTEDELANIDSNGSGKVEVREAMAIYRAANGLA